MNITTQINQSINNLVESAQFNTYGTEQVNFDCRITVGNHSQVQNDDESDISIWVINWNLCGLGLYDEKTQDKCWDIAGPKLYELYNNIAQHIKDIYQKLWGETLYEISLEQGGSQNRILYDSQGCNMFTLKYSDNHIMVTQVSSAY